MGGHLLQIKIQRNNLRRVRTRVARTLRLRFASPPRTATQHPSGNIPASLTTMSRLRVLWVHDNPGLKGVVPAALGSMPSLLR